MSKGLPAHVSFVNQVEMTNNITYALTTGIHDECIMQWKVIAESNTWDLDYNEYDLNDQVDLIQEVLPKDKFKIFQTKIVPMRKDL